MVSVFTEQIGEPTSQSKMISLMYHWNVVCHSTPSQIATDLMHVSRCIGNCSQETDLGYVYRCINNGSQEMRSTLVLLAFIITIVPIIMTVAAYPVHIILFKYCTRYRLWQIRETAYRNLIVDLRAGRTKSDAFDTDCERLQKKGIIWCPIYP